MDPEITVYARTELAPSALHDLQLLARRWPGRYVLKVVVGKRTVAIGPKVDATRGLIERLYQLGRVEVARPFEQPLHPEGR